MKQTECNPNSEAMTHTSKEAEATTATTNATSSPSATSSELSNNEIIRSDLSREIIRGTLRAKLSKRRHLILPRAIHPAYLDSLFPSLLENFQPQSVTYNGGIANIKQWKISCYLEVMEGGVPCTDPHLGLRGLFLPLLGECDALFKMWYRQQHACNGRKLFGKFKMKADGAEKIAVTGGNDGPEKENASFSAQKNVQQLESGTGSGGSNDGNEDIMKVKRLMTFITRYTANPDENALLKHVDGAGKVDGSLVVALPIDRWSAPEEVNSFEGHGGGLTFWDGKGSDGRPEELQYDTRSGDVALIDRAVWHQANPITKGTRWALVIFYKVE